ncbi:MAG: hypothetical protein AABY27_01370 [Pseudomonadota bacterium]
MSKEEFNKNKVKLEKHFKDRLPASIIEHQEVEKKTGGVFSGFVGTLNQDEEKYMLKPARMDSTGTTKQEINARNEILHEHIAPFERLLYGNAPVIGITTQQEGQQASTPNSTASDTHSQNSFQVDNDDFDMIDSDYDGSDEDDGKTSPHALYVRSKFLDNFTTLSEAKKDKTRSDELTQIKGFERVVAACMFLGDHDYHDENLGVSVRDGESHAVKIDHGHAGESFEADEKALRQALHDTLGTNNPLPAFKYNYLNFNINEFKRAVDEISSVSDEEMENIIERKAYNLQKSGFKLDDNLTFKVGKETKLLAPADPSATTDEEKMRSRYKNLVKNYLYSYKKQKAAFQEVSKKLDIIAKIDMPEEWKNREWIEMVHEDPIKWAIENGKTIEGQSPSEWQRINHPTYNEKPNLTIDTSYSSDSTKSNDSNTSSSPGSDSSPAHKKRRKIIDFDRVVKFFSPKIPSVLSSAFKKPDKHTH